MAEVQEHAQIGIAALADAAELAPASARVLAGREPEVAGQVATRWLAREDRLRAWACEHEPARGHNKAAVALANKMARIAWAVWQSEREYAATRPTPSV